jgi:hypothetical protein
MGFAAILEAATRPDIVVVYQVGPETKSISLHLSYGTTPTNVRSFTAAHRIHSAVKARHTSC